MNQTITLKLYHWIEWLFRLATINLLWLVFISPVVFLGLGGFVINQSQIMFLTYLILFLFSIPCILVPATSAAFSIMRDITRGHSIKLIQDFWQAFKKHYKISVLSGFVLTIIWTIFIIDYIFFSYQSQVLKFIFTALFLFLAMSTLHYFSLLVHSHNRFFERFKNAIFLTLKNPIISVLTVFTLIVILYIFYRFLPILLIFFSLSLISYSAFMVFYKISIPKVAQHDEL